MSESINQPAAKKAVNCPDIAAMDNVATLTMKWELV